MILSDGISNVRAFALPAGVGSDGQANQLTGAAIVKWRSTYDDMLHQVYVNGRFAGVTIDSTQRQIVVPLPLSQETAVRIEVFAVDLQNANTDFSETIGTDKVQSARIKIEFPKTMDGNADIYCENEKQNKAAIKIKNDFSEKIGFGLSCFGKSDFGYDGSAAIGFGSGAFGMGWFGFDADMFCWQSEQLDAGTYKFNITITDSKGNQTQETIETETIIVIPPATPAETLAVESFDKQSGKLILIVA